MKRLLIFLLIPTLLAGAPQDDWDLYTEGRGHWFDGDYLEALSSFHKLMQQFPESKRRCKAWIKVGYCYEKLGDNKNAFATFDAFIKEGDCNRDLVNDAKSELLNLAFKMTRDDSSKREVLVDGLKDDNMDIRFIAAVFLAQLGDRACLPVLFDVFENDNDQDRRDTAYRRILELGNDADRKRLEDISAKRAETGGGRPKMIKLIIRDVNTNKVETRVQVPIRLAKVIINALNDEQTRAIYQEYGIDINEFNLPLEDMDSGRILFSLVDSDGKEIKIFLE